MRREKVGREKGKKIRKNGIMLIIIIVIITMLIIKKGAIKN